MGGIKVVNTLLANNHCIDDALAHVHDNAFNGILSVGWVPLYRYISYPLLQGFCIKRSANAYVVELLKFRAALSFIEIVLNNVVSVQAPQRVMAGPQVVSPVLRVVDPMIYHRTADGRFVPAADAPPAYSAQHNFGL